MMHRYHTLRCALIATLCLSATPAGARSCLEYEPVIVTLSGTITRHMEYGSPNFGEDPAHDEQEIYWYLDLDEPICLNGKNEDSPDMESEGDLQRLQIVYRKYPRGSGWIGQHVSITGKLFHAHTGHHHTQVLIQSMSTKKTAPQRAREP